MLVAPASLAAANINFSTMVQGVLTSTPVLWDKIATHIPSTTAETRHAWLDLLPEMREWLGERRLENLSARIYALINKDYERTVKIPVTAFEDDTIGVYANPVRQLAEAAKKWPDKLVFDALLAGDTEVCFDGQYFFDTDHLTDPDDSASTTQSNKLTSSALTYDNYGTARATMYNFKGRDGVSLEIVPDLLVVPPQLEATARAILNGDYVVNTAGATPAAGASMTTNIWKGSANLLVAPRLSGEATTWYLMCTSRVVKPLIFQERKKPTFGFLDSPTSENVFMRNELLYGVDSRGVAGYGPWFLALSSIA